MLLGEPIDHILADPPNVWLTSVYGWSPETWGCIGFSLSGQRDKFLRKTKPGALIVIYGAKSSETPEDMRGKVLGFYQTNHQIGHSHEFIAPVRIEQNKRLNRLDKWTDGVKCVGAWELIPENRITIESFAPETYGSQAAILIGSQGVRLLPNEAKKMLDLTFERRKVYGGENILASSPAQLSPSKAVVGATKNYEVIVEQDSPKELYILRLKGNLSHFLNKQIGALKGYEVIKVGFSKSPQSRCNHFNRSLPKCAFEWEILKSTLLDNHALYANQAVAIVGEDRMKIILDEHSKCLGGEFFLTHRETIDEAWFGGHRAALTKQKPE